MKHISHEFFVPFTSFNHFSEHDILDLQELFLSPGMHELTVPNIAAGRELMSSVLTAFNCFPRIACLTTASLPLPAHVTHLHDEMALHGALAFSNHQLDSFLLEHFYYDFLWIEVTPELLQSAWYPYFQLKLIDFNLAMTLPIIAVSYERKS